MSRKTGIGSIGYLLFFGLAAFAGPDLWDTTVLQTDPTIKVAVGSDINDDGVILGRGGPDYWNMRGLIWRNGTVANFEDEFEAPDGYLEIGGNGLSNTGVVAGYANNSNTDFVAVLWDLADGSHEVVHPSVAGYDISSIYAIADNGMATGLVGQTDAGSIVAQRAYRWNPDRSTGQLLALSPEFDATGASDVNSAGWVVGDVYDSATYRGHAAVWRPDGTLIDLHPYLVALEPAIQGSDAGAISEEGVVVGTATAPTADFFVSWAWSWTQEEGVKILKSGGHDHATANVVSGNRIVGYVGEFYRGAGQMAMWIDGILTTVSTPDGFSATRPFGMNNHGDVVGNARIEDTDWWKDSRAFLWTVGDGDYDGDALKDKWELQGYEHDNGEQVDLPSMGANPLRRDLFVEIDSMVGGGYDHRPDAETLQPIVDAFAAHDIALHLHIDDDLPFDANLGTLDGLGRYQWGEFDALKSAHFEEELESAVRYCVFGHRLAALTDSGLARGEPSSDFIVSLGAFVEESGSTDPWMQAGTFMHELGHTLGLRHGGADVTNRKPNYLSVMNYDFQKQGLRIGGKDGHFDYSQAKLAGLDEGALLETVGLGIEPLVAGYQTLYRVVTLDPITFETTVVAVWSGEVQGSIDWNGSGSIDGAAVSADINGNGSTEMLTGHHDWAALDFNGGTVGFGVGLPPPPPPPETEVVEELTVEEAKLIPPPPVEGMAGRAGRRSVRISWTPVGPYGQGSYKVYRWSDTQDRELVAETQASLISDRPGRGTWHYVVTVTDSLGAESLDSELLTLRVR